MKISFTTLGCPDWSFEKILDESQRLGYGAIEIRGIDRKMRAEEIAQFFPENVERTQAALRAHGLEICGFGTSVMFHNPDKFDAALAEGLSAIDVCQRMGIPGIRIFGDQFPEGEDRAETIARVARGVRALCDAGEDKGVNVLLEVHGQFNTLDAVQGVIDAVNSPRFGILWDIEHSDKTYGDDWMTFYRGIQSHIRLVHVKDHLRAGGAFQLCLLGEGDIPIADIVRQMIADGYAGYFSLEWEKAWHPELPEPEVAIPAYAEMMRAILP